MSRLSMCAEILNKEAIEEYSLLDVGCRGKELKSLLRGIKRYQGIDLEASDEVMAHDLENRIPLDDSTFDVVVALDVVEHVENSHQLMSELLRIAKDKVIVSLPNMYHWKFRIYYLFGREIGDKYRFPARPKKDRHRWLTSYQSSKNFIFENSGGCDVNVIPIVIERRNKLFQMVDYFGVKAFPNLFAYGGMYVLSKGRSSKSI